MTRAIAIAAVFAALACGDDGPAEREVAEVVTDAEGRLVVARVNGRPVFGSCVQTQAEAHGLDARAALDECIDFELLAQEAERRGYGAAPDAVEAQRREAVRALLRTEFEAEHDDPADIPLDAVKRVYSRPGVHLKYNHPEYRFAYYARADSEDRIRALYADLKDERGLTREKFWAAIDRHTTDDFQFSVSPKPVNSPRERSALDPVFVGAMFSIPEAGMVSEPVKTRWGWDLLFLARIDPPVRHRVEEVADEIRRLMFPSWQSQEFNAWSQQLAANASVHVEDGWDKQLPQEDLVEP